MIARGILKRASFRTVGKVIGKRSVRAGLTVAGLQLFSNYLYSSSLNRRCFFLAPGGAYEKGGYLEPARCPAEPVLG